MIGVWSRWTSVGKWSHTTNTRGANLNRSRMGYQSRGIFTLFYVVFFVVTVMVVDCVYGQQQRPQLSRRPLGSPALEAYRNRWMAYLNSKTTSTSTTTTRRPSPVRIRGGSEENSSPVVNGFQCQKIYSLFADTKNPRMYHLCARARDNWYVYHYFCPHGTVFNDGMKKCVQNRDSVEEVASTPSRRPTVNTPPVLQKTTTSTTTTTQRPSSTSEEPEPVPEPDSDHTDATESIPSSEEISNEEGIDVVISPPLPSTGFEEHRVEQVAHEHIEASNEHLNLIIPEAEGVNEEIVLAVSSTPLTTSASPKQTPLRRVPLRRIKVPTNDSMVDDESITGKNTSLNERRPRILKKLKNWRDFLKAQHF